MQSWRKIPTSWIANLGAVRWTTENPAPDAVGFIWSVDQLAGGVPLSIRALASAMGWSRRHGDRILKQAKEWDKLCTKNGTSYAPPKPNDSGTIEAKPGRNRDKLRTKNGTPHVRASLLRENRIDRTTTIHVGVSELTTNENLAVEQKPISKPPAGSSVVDAGELEGGSALDYRPAPKKADRSTANPAPDIAALWDEMEAIRLRNVSGSRRAAIGKRRDTLRRRVSEHGRDVVLHTWLWLWESQHKRAVYLRDEGYGLATFLRASNLRDYVDMSRVWDPSAEEKPFDIWNTTDDDFDENGMLIAH